MNIRFLVLLMIAVVTGFTACKKTYDDAPKVTTQTSLDVVNAYTDTVNFYLNGTRLNNNSNLYPGISSGYYVLNIPAGEQNYQIKKMFNPASSTVQPLFSIPQPVDPYYYHSLFIAGPTVADAFFTQDALAGDTTVNDSTCYVRFVNASPDAGSLDFTVGDTVKFTSQAFKTASGYVTVGVNGKKAISVYHTGQSTPILSGVYNIGPGNIYTFYAKGSISGTGATAFGIGANLAVTNQ
jgi:hypothetical protein